VRSWELVRFALSGLWRQKVRSALTLVGVAVGACALAFSLSLAFGLRSMIDREFRGRASFWEVHVRVADRGTPAPEADIPADKIAVPAGVAGDRHDRIRRKLVRDYQNSHPAKPPKPLTADRVAELAAIPDVIDVVAGYAEYGSVRLGDGGRPANIAARPARTLDFGGRLLAGTLPTSDDADDVVVTEYLLYDLGVKTDADLAAAVGRPLGVTIGAGVFGRTYSLASSLGVPGGAVAASDEQLLDKIAARLPQAIDGMDLHPLEKAAVKRMLAAAERRKAEADPTARSAATARHEFRIAAVVRNMTPDEEDAAEKRFDYFTRHYEVFLTPGGGRRLFEQLPWVRDAGYPGCTVKLRPGGDLRGVVAAVEAQGFKADSSLVWYDSVKMEVTLIAGGLNLFAWASLFVAALGITNTLATSVVERTREIGILKAVGATRRQVLLLFLAEGTAVGLAGGAVGLAAAWGLSFPGDGLVSRLVREQSQGHINATTVFDFPTWLPATTILFATGVTTVAAFFPARRAARLEPVRALRGV